MYTVSALTCAELIGYFCFITLTSRTMSKVFSIKNSLLFMLLLCQGTYFITHGIYVTNPINSELSVANGLAFAGWLVFYIWSSWTRSHEVFRITSNPVILRIIRVLLILTTLLAFGPVVVLLLPINPTSQEVYVTLTNVLAGIGVFSIDSFFAFNYCRYIFRRTIETVQLKHGDMEIEVVALFKIITQYGLMTSILMAGTLCFYIWFLVVASDDSEENLKTYSLLLAFVDVGVFFISLPLVMMKVKLVQLQKEIHK
ncbi:hypothetical protein BDR26DRAFT_855872 [Obelidium mucronatum]|nr:hypothetical protein BDR26DRAFT_855872 [Obelidium mucronatum]